MPGGSGVDACRQVRAKYPDIKVIMLTSYTDDEAIFASVMAGASGYVLKQVGSEDLIKAIRTVHAGGSLLDPSTTQRVLERMRPKDPLSDLPEPLTEQERRLLSLIAEGKTNREIAAIVYLSEKTVRNYVSNILAKLGLSNRAEAAAFAVRHGLADPCPDDKNSPLADGLRNGRGHHRHPVWAGVFPRGAVLGGAARRQSPSQLL